MTRRVPIPDGEIKLVLDLLRERHRLHLRPGERFSFEGSLTHGDAQARLVLSDPEETDVMTLEGRIELEPNQLDNPADGKDAVIDLMDDALNEYFSSERAWRPPMDWSEFKVGERIIWMRGSVRNLMLERMADALLGDEADLYRD